MIENYTILCDSNIPWSHNRYSKHHIMSRLAKKNRVIFIDPPRPLSTQIKEFGLSALSGCKWKPENEALTVLTPSQFPLNDKSDLVVNIIDPRYFVSQIKHALDRYDTRKLILFLGNPWNTHLLKTLPAAACSIYHCSDDFPSLFDGPFRQRLAVRENEMIRAVDLVLAVSTSLVEKCRTGNNRTHYFPNAVDEIFFLPAAEPGELFDLPRPIVGYAGSIDERLDFQLIFKTAQKLNKYTFVFIGYVANKVQSRWESITALPNVSYLGPKQWNQLPGYLQAFDCCINPLARDEFNLARSPLKIYEYLASGRMAVTTMPVEPSKRLVVQSAETDEAFADSISIIVENNSKAIGHDVVQKYVEQDTWDKRVEILSKLISENSAVKK